MVIIRHVTLLTTLLLSFAVAANIQYLDSLQVVELVVNNSTRVELARINLALAKSEIPASLYPFDWNLSVNIGQKSEHLPSASIYENQSYRQSTFGPSVGATRLFQNGVELDMSIQFLEYDTSSATTLFTQRKQMGASLSLNIPLLKGRGQSVNTTDYNLALLKQEKYQAKLADRLDQSVLKALEYLLKLYELRKEVELKERDMEYSKSILDFDHARYKTGKLSRVDYLNSQALYQKKVGLLEVAKLKAYNQDILLQKEIFPPHIAGTTTILPKVTLTDRHPLSPFAPMDLGHLPSIIVEKIGYRERQVELFEAKNGLLPELDLEIALSNSGLGSEAATAFDQVATNRYFNWEVALNFSWIFGNHQALGSVAAKQARLRKAVTTRRSLFRQKLQKWRSTRAEMKKLEEGLAQIDGQREVAHALLEFKLEQYKLQHVSSLELAQAQQDLLKISQERNSKLVKLGQTYNQLMALNGKLYKSPVNGDSNH
ncbi:MAG: TolC family protein [Bdellovibrionales bacterium]|nr:TolC family protein [Bdellovibrionales bacterium]MBT3526936.1 TolC family protein [Bdellovibrionales bacterium]MBT7767470.1 TolC family protein [Bdellovibrionales bacterium]